MVALTLTVTLSRVMTSCLSPVRGVSRISTRPMESTSGTRNVMPGWRTEWNCPARLTIPTNTCWMMLTVRAMMTNASRTRTPPMINDADMIPPLLSDASAWHSRYAADHQDGATKCGHDDGRGCRERRAIFGERRPRFPGDLQMARFAVSRDRLGQHRLLADHAVGAGAQRWAAQVQALDQVRPGDEDAGDAENPQDDRLDKQPKPQQGDNGGAERAARDEEGKA